MHEVVPGKLLVMRGPRDLPGEAQWLDVHREDGSFSHRDFSPTHYAEILQQFDVQVVVRCNAPQYDKCGFEDAGIAVVDLVYEDCGAPPVDVMAKFLGIAEAVSGAVAIHCASGLGRTGTLIALYMMKHHHFTAREAMGWLRIVRPGRCSERLHADVLIWFRGIFALVNLSRWECLVLCNRAHLALSFVLPRARPRRSDKFPIADFHVRAASSATSRTSSAPRRPSCAAAA